MKTLDNLFLRKASPGENAKAPPDKGAARFIYLTYTHFAKLVGLNMLFLLFCVPVVTIPAALSGMNRVCMLLIREGTACVWSDFVEELKASCLKSLPLGALCAFFLLDATLCAWLSLHSQIAGMAISLLAAALLLSLFTLLLGCYAFAMLSLVSLRTTDVLRNALLLILTQPVSDLFLLLIAGGSAAAAVWFLPFSIPVIAVIGPALVTLAVCSALRGPVERLIVGKADNR
jgi:hypothetical protein